MKRYIFVILLLLAGVAYAANEFVQKYDVQNKYNVFLAPQGADTVGDLTSTDYVANHVYIQLQHYQTLTLHASFQTAGANAKLRVVRGYTAGGLFVPSSSASATATAQSVFKFKDPNYYTADDVVFDTANFPVAMVIVESISGGNVWVTASVH
jgi:hypothetical protein